MVQNIYNLVFEGGGIFGIAYLGVLDYLYQNNLLSNLRRIAGTSSGSIAACLTSLNIPFDRIKAVADSLDYHKVPYKEDFQISDLLSEEIKNSMEPLFGDVNCLYRLITRYGWFSTEYFYQWLQNTIAVEFNDIKRPPYTFADFQDPRLHKDNRRFKDLFIIGTNLTTGTSKVFSNDTTPTMEVAHAVRISISIPLFFEAVQLNQPEISGNDLTCIYCDGGIINNYPLRLFDSMKYETELLQGINSNTLGIRFKSGRMSNKINNLFEYIWSLAVTAGRAQQEAFYNEPMDIARSISIDAPDISPVDFNISPGDVTYNQLYRQGFLAAHEYFTGTGVAPA